MDKAYLVLFDWKNSALRVN